MPGRMMGRVALVAFLLVPLAAQAIPLPPGTTNDNPLYLPGGANPDFTNGLPLWFVPANNVASMTVPYIGAFTGAITSNVYADPTPGPTLGFLGFEYIWTNTTPGGTLDIIRSTIGGITKPWAGWSILDAGSDTSGSSTLGGGAPAWTDGSPNFLLRDPVVSGEGLTVQWRASSVGTVLRNPTDTSARIWFLTDAQTYATASVGILDSGSVAVATAYAPGPSGVLIPEPATLSLLGLGLLAAARRRRK